MLFEVLSTIYNSPTAIELYKSSTVQREAVAEFHTRQSKTDKIKEWKNLPLATDEQRFAWWQRTCGMVGTLGCADGMVPKAGSGLGETAPGAAQEPRDVVQLVSRNDTAAAGGCEAVDGDWEIPVSALEGRVADSVALDAATQQRWHKYF